jgi:hypothetical protein
MVIYLQNHNILNRWKNYFSQLLNVHRVSNVRQIEIHTAEPLVSDRSSLEVEVAVAKLKRYKSPCSYQMWARTSRKTPPSIIKDTCFLFRYLTIDVLLSRARLLRECVYRSLPNNGYTRHCILYNKYTVLKNDWGTLVPRINIDFI